MSKYRVLITGSRSWYPERLADRVVASLVAKHGRENLIVVHGAAKGVDITFANAAVEQGVAVEPHPALWDDIDKPGAVVRHRHDGTPYDAAAGPNRNDEMVKAGADVCLAFHPDPGKGRGTADCMKRAMRAGIPTWWIGGDGFPPVRQKLAGGP